MALILGAAGAIVVLWAFTRYFLRGADLSRYDEPAPAVEVVRAEQSPEHAAVVASLQQFRAYAGTQSGGSSKDRLDAMRRGMEAIPAQLDLGVEIRSADANGVPAEWVLAPSADPDARLLYVHGGAFTMGSPKSHRVFTATLSKMLKVAVLAIDYRLMPENRRLDGVADCQASYRWIIDHGPNGAGPAETFFVAGDSAGGNLILMLIAWARDRGLRAVDAAVALSPGTDGTGQSPSMVDNIDADILLGPMFKAFAKVPKSVALWWHFVTNRVRPSNPLVSPIHGDLAGLPPTLVHASEAEMLFDDARRYVVKARHAGSPAVLQTWPHVMHVWHGTVLTVPEAREAFDRIGEFIESHKPGAERRLAQ